MQMGTELYAVVGQFGAVLGSGPEDFALSAKAILDAQKYGPFAVKPVHEVAENTVHATLPKYFLARFRR